jgi:hypothetical protein
MLLANNLIERKIKKTWWGGACGRFCRTILYGAPRKMSSTTAAERQDPDFLIGPRNKKQRKKRSTIKILHPPFQITSRDF